mgnify:CR=1 FL=1
MNERQFFHHCADITTDSAMRSESVIYDDNLASNTQFNFYFNDKTAEDLDQENKAEKYVAPTSLSPTLKIKEAIKTKIA